MRLNLTSFGVRLFAGSLGVCGVIALLILPGIIGALCWPYVFNTWLVYTGKSACVVWWHGFLLGFVPRIGGMAIPAAVTTWILMLFSV